MGHVKLIMHFEFKLLLFRSEKAQNSQHRGAMENRDEGKERHKCPRLLPVSLALLDNYRFLLK
jgi:hypothetical protein